MNTLFRHTKHLFLCLTNINHSWKLSAEKSIEDLSDEDFENLNEKMYEDPDCVEAFIKQDYEHMEEWMNKQGVHHDGYCDHEDRYCESRNEEFIRFAFDFFNKKT